MKIYLKELPFRKVRIIFKFRSRMFPTKANFPKRRVGDQCVQCGKVETDEHLFTCNGYSDLMIENISTPGVDLVSMLQPSLRAKQCWEENDQFGLLALWPTLHPSPEEITVWRKN